jgi:DHA1 family multidrug resistance protein-like MFS transporter
MYRDLILIGISLFLWGVGETAFFSFQPLYLEQLGASPILIGAILGGYGIAGILVHMPAGYLADHIGRKPVMLAGWLLGFFSTIVMFLARSLPLFVIGMIIYAATTFVVAPINSYVTSARGNLSVPRALTLTSIGFNLGAIVGPLFGGIIGDKYGFREIYLFAICIFVFSNLVIFFIRPQPLEQHSHSDDSKSLLTNFNFAIFSLLLFFSYFAMYLPQPLAPNYLQNNLGYSLLKIGQFYSINAIGIVFFNLVLGQLDAQMGFILSQIFMVVFSTILWKTSGDLWFTVAFFLLGSFRAARSLAVALIRSLVTPANMGLAFGIAETMGSFALILAPLLAGYLYANKPLSMFSISLLLTAFSIFFSVVFIRKKHAVLTSPL